MTVTFFGHSNAPWCIYENLYKSILNLIEANDQITFYVGNHGNFDMMANRILSQLSEKYAHIKYFTVLSYMPPPNQKSEFKYSILPEEVAASHPRYAISKRNDWMLKNSDTVISHVNHSHGGAAKYYSKAQKQGKTVINIL